MKHAHYLDWDGLVEYTKQLKSIIKDFKSYSPEEIQNIIKFGTPNPPADQQEDPSLSGIYNATITFTKNGEPVQTFTANQKIDTNLEIYNNEELTNIINYGIADISKISQEELERIKNERREQLGFPSKLSDLDNDKGYLSREELLEIINEFSFDSISYGNGEQLDLTKQIDSLFI